MLTSKILSHRRRPVPISVMGPGLPGCQEIDGCRDRLGASLYVAEGFDERSSGPSGRPLRPKDIGDGDPVRRAAPALNVEAEEYPRAHQEPVYKAGRR